jgi:uncharacterized protein with HEPN domain
VSKRSAELLIGDMIEALERIEVFTVAMNRDAFLDDDKTFLAVCRCLEILGEAAAQMPNESKRQLVDVPWPRLVALRNRVIHAYFDVDRDLVWTIISRDAPPLLTSLRSTGKK